MEASTQAHRKTLRRLCTLGKIAGWGMIVLGFLSIGVLTFAHFISGGDTHISIALVRGAPTVVSHFLAGLIALGTVQLARYALEEDSEPRWLLRKGHIILSAFSVSLLWAGVLAGISHSWPILQRGLNGVHSESPAETLMGVTVITLLTLLPTVAKALCVLGLAALLRALLPILAESKTLA